MFKENGEYIRNGDMEGAASSSCGNVQIKGSSKEVKMENEQSKFTEKCEKDDEKRSGRVRKRSEEDSSHVSKKVKRDEIIHTTLNEIDTTYSYFTSIIHDFENKREEFKREFLKLKEKLENAGVLKEY